MEGFWKIARAMLIALKAMEVAMSTVWAIIGPFSERASPVNTYVYRVVETNMRQIANSFSAMRKFSSQFAYGRR